MGVQTQGPVVYMDIFEKIDGENMPVIISTIPIELADMIYNLVMSVPYASAYSKKNIIQGFNAMSTNYQALILFLLGVYGDSHVTQDKIIKIEQSIRLKIAKGHKKLLYVYNSPTITQQERAVYKLTK